MEVHIVISINVTITVQIGTRAGACRISHPTRLHSGKVAQIQVTVSVAVAFEKWARMLVAIRPRSSPGAAKLHALRFPFLETIIADAAGAGMPFVKREYFVVPQRSPVDANLVKQTLEATVLQIPTVGPEIEVVAGGVES